ncbi:MAG: hypothetical protein H0U98_01485 [Alphaproteobacteria bacterium]|nr:hypothetical protein [Alphaproteobacteria bacterium]
MIEVFRQHRLSRALRAGSEVGAFLVLIGLACALWADRHAIGFGIANTHEMIRIIFTS